jgi:hypothetical protein
MFLCSCPASQALEGEERLLLVNFCQWLYDLSVSATVRESSWVFPTLEWIHIYSMVFLITVIAALDLRLLGIAIRRQERQPLPQLSRRVLRWAWGAFTLNAATGTLLFASKAPDYYINSAFRIKILLIFLGLLYHSVVIPMVVVPRAARWEEIPVTPLWAKLAGGFSLLLWVGVIAASRWIAFV